uniref:HMA domain-containing protein n=1 Tax=Chromera velia CCMP2878 TaxID=1169474 RepID=A0A0G4GBC2_9ALVE|eukprot:Cvel_21079.t1-p1 / transcript=Cvel_21079.t1 / gene=Cvel_21079 / organism=Chromera_velia_CCMP2878 / gene_product=hypothetical protein / transcript_product=hypothetical protein / location=Cvel_scaffold1948:22764-25614(+) / protein_length=552 / sequence_SO=supercontig / SO=protein_coding / is_pseudo=false
MTAKGASRQVPQKAAATKKKPAYNLLFSWSFLAQTILCTSAVAAALFFAQRFRASREVFESVYDWVIDNLISKANEMAWWSLIALLSSSCCAFQLILNLFSIGCAGFNTVLGPVRPVFLSLTFCLQVWMWVSLERDHQYPQAVASTVLTAFLTFLPEVLFLFQNCRGWRRGKEREGLVHMRMRIEGMGCVACVDAIHRAIMGTQHVASVRVLLEKGEAEVEVKKTPEKAPEKILQEACDRVTASGFPSVPFEDSKEAIAASEEEYPKQGLTEQQEAGKDDVHSPPPSGLRQRGTNLRSKVFDKSSFGGSEKEGEKKKGHFQQREKGESPGTVIGRWLGDLVAAVFAGLLGSSCCALQLGLNFLSAIDVLHVGCAGFNKVLGPLRPTLRFVIFCWLSFLWFRVLTSGQKEGQSGAKQKRNSITRLTVRTLLTLLLLFLPEVLRYGGGPAIAPPPGNARRLVFTVDNMGCEACESAVRLEMERFDGVLQAEVDFETGRAELLAAEDWGFSESGLDERLRLRGYELHEEGWMTRKMKFDAMHGSTSMKSALGLIG